MKRTYRLTALLLCSAMLCGSVPAVPVSAEDSAVSQPAESAASDALTGFLTRIAGWDDADMDDCILLTHKNASTGQNSFTFLTPKHPYSIHAASYYGEANYRYRVSFSDEHAADTPTLRNRLYDVLTAQGKDKDAAEKISLSAETRTKTDAGYIVEGVAASELKRLTEVTRIEAPQVYHTDTNVGGTGLNYTSAYSLTFQCSSALTAADFPQLSGVTVKNTDGTWELTLNSTAYEDYFTAFRYVRTLPFVSDLNMGWVMTEVSVTSEESFSEPFAWKTLYDKRIPDASETLTEFLGRIAGWENTTLDQCIIIPSADGGVQLLTPTKLYNVTCLRNSNFEVTLDAGTALDTDAVLAKWKAMLKAAGCPEKQLYANRCTLTKTGADTYCIETGMNFYGDLTIADCLKDFWNVTSVSVRYHYWTSDRPNSTFFHTVCVACDKEPSAADFPALDGVTITKDKEQEYDAPEGCWLLSLSDDKYADYFAALKYVQTLEFVRDARLMAISTALADDNPDAQITDREPDVLYRRGELVLPVFGDHSLDDPYRRFYIYGESYLDADSPKQKNVRTKYFNGQIYVPGGKDLPASPQTEGMKALYSSYAQGWFFWKEDTMTTAEAEALCAEIKEYYAQNTDITLSCDPTPVYCTKLPPTCTGDINGDSEITIHDAKKLLDSVVLNSISAASKIYDVTMQLHPNADVNGDGKVNILDAKYILDYSVWQQTMKQKPDWAFITGRTVKAPDIDADQ